MLGSVNDFALTEAGTGFLGFGVFTYSPSGRSTPKDQLPNFDKRSGSASNVSQPQRAAIFHLRALVPQARVDFDPLTGAPKFISVPDGFLTPASASASDPHAPTKSFLREHSALF